MGGSVLGEEGHALDERRRGSGDACIGLVRCIPTARCYCRSGPPSPIAEY